MHSYIRNFIFGLVVSFFMLLEYGFVYVTLFSMFVVFVNMVDAMSVGVCKEKGGSGLRGVDVVLDVFLYFLGVFAGLTALANVKYIYGLLRLL